MKCNFHIKLPTFLAPLLLLFKITLDLLTKKLKKKRKKEKEKEKKVRKKHILKSIIFFNKKSRRKLPEPQKAKWPMKCVLLSFAHYKIFRL
jgi:hypothetical protein